MDTCPGWLTALGLALASLAVAGCGDMTGPPEVFLAKIEVDPELLPISIADPSIVRSKTPFNVEIVTYFNKPCEEVGPTEVHVEGLRAVVMPFDQRIPGAICLDVTTFGTHRASVQFDTRGTATLIVRGWSSFVQDTIEVENVIIVF